ncbi:goannatyrotoxin-Vere1-like [Zootoca vivipara]|uniref:goannatyrotoxin-Vere1-like n=1 Tax=Zootoca vivipara TaxID=8524 RepID=UPI00293B9296|nr:goannatyrotoxin-Vere1-like [Zootoca vivipara]
MVASLKSWPLMITVSLCILFCLGTLVEAYPEKPVEPRRNASREEWIQYFIELRRYIDLVTRSRYGKRSIPENLMSELSFGDSSSSSSNSDHKK